MDANSRRDFLRLVSAGAGLAAAAPRQALEKARASVPSDGGDEENPQDIQLGENFSAGVINAVLSSPAWRRARCASGPCGTGKPSRSTRRS